MHNKNKHTLPNRYINIIVSVLIISTCFIVLKCTHESRLFKKYVCNPIPKSVRNIRAHESSWPSWDIFGHKYVMHFKASKSDVELILTSKRFKEVEWFKYENGLLTWGDTPPWEKKNEGEYVAKPHWEAESLGLYPQYKRRPGPVWFKPNDWDSPKVYSFEERTVSYQKQIQILIYNEDLDEAYLVDYYEGYR